MPTQAEVDLIVNATRTLPELERDLDRVLRAAQADMSDLDVDVVLDQTATLRQLDRDLDRVIASARAGADDIDLDAALNQQASIRQMTRDLDNLVRAVSAPGVVPPALVTAALNAPRSLARIRGELDDVVRAAQAGAPDIDIDVNVDDDRIRRLASSALSAAGAVGRLGVSVGVLGAAVGTAAPLLAGLAGAVQNVAPAAAIATTGILAMQLATQTLRLGMQGVGDAITEAFAPDPDMEKVNEALARLSPSARAAATEIISLKDSFKDLQLDVQERLFKGFSEEIEDLAKTVLPDVRGALLRTAGTLNQMGKGVSEAAQQLAEGGVLGQALSSANAGLNNLKDVPGQIVLAFGELAAAAGPSFERVTKAIAGVVDQVGGSLTDAFKSGGLEDAISDSVDAIAQLGRVFGNVFGGIGNIIEAVSLDGQGLFGTLEQLSQAFEDITGTQEFQDGLRALSETMALLYKTAGPLFAEAIKIIAEVLVELAEPAQELIEILGDSLGEILAELGPVLVALAKSFGKLVVALGPLITLAADLLVAILPALVPLFENLGRVFEEAAPFVAQLAESFATSLVPMLESLGPILEEILPQFAEMAERIFPQLTNILVELQPSLMELSRAFADLLVAAAPLIAALLEMSAVLLGKLLEAYGPAIVTAVETFTGVLTLLSDFISGVLFESFQVIIDLLHGNFDEALKSAGRAGDNLRDVLSSALESLTGISRQELTEFRQTVETNTREAANRLREAISSGVSDALGYLRDLPGRARGALGDLNNLLFSAGQGILQGLIDGIQSKIGEVRSTLGGLTDLIPDWKGPMDLDKRLLTPSGEAIIDSLVQGFRNALPDVRAELGGLTMAVPSMVAPSFNPVLSTQSAAPVIRVTIGNEAVDQYVTTRVERAENQRTRTMAQGVRF